MPKQPDQIRGAGFYSADRGRGLKRRPLPSHPWLQSYMRSGGTFHRLPDFPIQAHPALELSFTFRLISGLENARRRMAFSITKAPMDPTMCCTRALSRWLSETLDGDGSQDAIVVLQKNAGGSEQDTYPPRR